MIDIKRIKKIIDPHKEPNKQFFLDLLDKDKQEAFEREHIDAVMFMLRAIYINKLKAAIKSAQEQISSLVSDPDYDAESYRRVMGLKAEIAKNRAQIETYKPFFDEPYFARMDVVDDKDGYNSYYIGKRGDEGLEIVDWRAPLARRYYQKSRVSFSINEYNYKLVLRRALRTKSGKVVDMQNEYLSVKDYLSKEEIGGRDEEIIFDPFLREIIKSRKEKSGITDIIDTIQEKQYEIITLPEDSRFVVQGIAGSGKTMIMLHRLSYIMYNNEGVKPRDVLVITPSDSFNAFIDELSTVLELEKVKTSTIERYFTLLLSGQGIDIEGRVERNERPPYAYLSYIYSKAFITDVDKKTCQNLRRRSRNVFFGRVPRHRGRGSFPRRKTDGALRAHKKFGTARAQVHSRRNQRKGGRRTLLHKAFQKAVQLRGRHRRISLAQRKRRAYEHLRLLLQAAFIVL